MKNSKKKEEKKESKKTTLTSSHLENQKRYLVDVMGVDDEEMKELQEQFKGRS